MGKTMLMAVAFLTLLEEVISSEYPVLESMAIGGLVLLILAAWTDGESERPHEGRGGVRFFLRALRMAAERLKRTGRTATPPTLPSSAPR